MGTISSTGVGSGLDVKSIVSQLVAIEKQPLVALQTKASTIQAQFSLYGTLKSQAGALESAANVLSSASGWNAQKASSSNAAAVGVTAGAATEAVSMSVEVSQLARAQSSASAGVLAGTKITTAGTLSIQLGSWVGSTFTGSATAIGVDIAVDDTVANIASKINATADVGVSASVLRDGAKERLVIRSKTSGEVGGFRVDAPSGTDLSMYGFENTTAGSPTATSAGVATGAAVNQTVLDSYTAAKTAFDTYDSNKSAFDSYTADKTAFDAYPAAAAAYPAAAAAYTLAKTEFDDYPAAKLAFDGYPAAQDKYGQYLTDKGNYETALFNYGKAVDDYVKAHDDYGTAHDDYVLASTNWNLNPIGPAPVAPVAPVAPGLAPVAPVVVVDPGATSPLDPGLTRPTDPGSAPVDPGTAPLDPGTAPTDPGLTRPADPGTTVPTAGKLTIQLGSWSGLVFAGSSAAVNVDISVSDTVDDIAAKINAAVPGNHASVDNSGGDDRLVFGLPGSGESAGFRITTASSDLLKYAMTAGAATSRTAVIQSAQDAKVKINGVDVTSATNNMADVAPGVSLQLTQITSAPVEITVDTNQDVIDKNIQGFVDAYNAMNTTLANATKYSAATKTGGVLQGDSATRMLQSSLNTILGSYAVYSDLSTAPANTAKHYLSDAGIERQKDGSLTINATKLTAAKQDLGSLKRLFFQDNTKTTNSAEENVIAAKTNGIGRQLKAFAHALLGIDGRVTNKSATLQSSIDRNLKDQDTVTTRASRVEAQLLRQYTALDTQMASLNGLSSYVNAQLAQWNKSSA